MHLHTHADLIWCCLSIWHYLWYTNKEANTHSHTLTRALSRHLQCGAGSEASGLSGNRTFISCFSSPHKTVGGVCVCVGCGPKCYSSSCRHDKRMILCVCPCIFVRAGRLISYSDKFEAEAAISVIFFPLLLLLCMPLFFFFKVSALPSRAEQPTIKHVHQASDMLTTLSKAFPAQS